MSLEQYVQAAPKAELHLHLEGSIRPETLLQIARRNDIKLPVNTVEETRQWFRFSDFPHFLDVFQVCTMCLRTAEDFEQITYEVAETLSRQNVRYAEVTFSPCVHGTVKNIPFDAYFGGLTRGRQRALHDFGVEINWIFDIVRNVNGAGDARRADYTLQMALECMKDGVVGLGLAGNEITHPAEWFTKWFDIAIAAGLHSTPHAGEAAGPQSVWNAIRLLGAERIGHGVRSIEDPELVAYLVEKHIPLEVNVTSNICLSIYPNYEAHPLPRLLAAGVPLTVNTDDPPFFNTTMNQEMLLLDRVYHLDITTIDTIILNGIRHSFLSQEHKRDLEADFEHQLAELKTKYIR